MTFQENHPQPLNGNKGFLEDEYWMQQALALAAQAEQQNEVPVGAVLVKAGKIIGSGFNQTIGLHDPSAHAEIMALRHAGQCLANYRQPNTHLYVTLEPCPMCAGMMIHARIQRLIFGAYDPKTGAAGSVFDLLQDKRHNHQVEIVGGILKIACADKLRQFFRKKRQIKR